MKLILKSLNQKISLKSGFFYSMVEFYFSGITPSSTGGQPMQLYYMTKDKIPIRKSYITLILNTIYFKIIILMLGVIVLFFGRNYILSQSIVYTLFFTLGFLVDLIIVVFSVLLLLKQNVIKKCLSCILRLANKFKFLINKIQNINIDDVLNKYNTELKYITSHKTLVFLTFVLTFVQRLLLFSIIFVIYRGLGFTYYNYFDLLMIQISVQLAIEAFPLPSGAGLSEEMLHRAFKSLQGINFATIGMLMVRTFSFYLPLLISGMVVVFYSLIKKRCNQK